MRLFVAIKLPKPLLDDIARFQMELARHLSAPHIKWVRPEQIHLTLCFLGEVQEQALAELKELLHKTASQYSAICLQPEGLNAFPSIQQPRVIFLGLKGELALLHSLADGIRQKLTRFGSHHEERAFHPHLTLCRISRGRRPQEEGLAKKLMRINVPSFCPWVARNVYLIESILRPSGPEYRDLCDAPLSATRQGSS